MTSVPPRLLRVDVPTIDALTAELRHYCRERQLRLLSPEMTKVHIQWRAEQLARTTDDPRAITCPHSTYHIIFVHIVAEHGPRIIGDLRFQQSLKLVNYVIKKLLDLVKIRHAYSTTRDIKSQTLWLVVFDTIAAVYLSRKRGCYL